MQAEIPALCVYSRWSEDGQGHRIQQGGSVDRGIGRGHLPERTLLGKEILIVRSGTC
jgi:hypothetical protein